MCVVNVRAINLNVSRLAADRVWCMRRIGTVFIFRLKTGVSVGAGSGTALVIIFIAISIIIISGI